MKTLKPAAELVLDYSLYPRHTIDDEQVRSITRAMEAGATIPPVVADRASLRVIDGFHRVTAALRHAGPDAVVAVDLRDYFDEAAMFADAVRRNASHGRRLTPYDEARCIIVADKLGIGRDRLAEALCVTKNRLEVLEARKISFDADNQPVAIKATASHLAQEHLTAMQTTGMRRTGGMSPLFYANQLINVLESDLLDRDNARLVERLAHLARLLDVALKVGV